MEKGRLQKIAFRYGYDATNDLCVVMAFNGRFPTILTVWLNEKTDIHRTLNRSQYTIPERKS